MDAAAARLPGVPSLWEAGATACYQTPTVSFGLDETRDLIRSLCSKGAPCDNGSIVYSDDAFASSYAKESINP